MKSFIKQIRVGAFVVGLIHSIQQSLSKRKIVKEWIRDGRPVPPPHEVKEMVVRRYARACGLKILVETGTYLGTMVDATKGVFERIITIELGKDLYKKTKERFSHYDHISFLHGNSGELLEKLLHDLSEPCLFWLDAHYSEGTTSRGTKNTPIKEELCHILQHPVEGHVVLIDDARCFTGSHDYPTHDELRRSVSEMHPEWVFDIQDDIVRIHGKPVYTGRI